MKKAIAIAVLALLGWTSTGAAAGGEGGPKISRKEYIAQWKDVAIEQMHKYGIPASIKLAQAILESADGNSMLARKANNHFGVKCHGWNGPGVYKDDDRRNECFRKYRNARESFDDHSAFLLKPRYAFLFDYDITDYKKWARGLKKAGYATNPQYPQLLIRIIEENQLYLYDRGAKGKPAARKETPRPVDRGKGGTIDYFVGRKEFVTDNGVHFVFAKEGDTYAKIARELNLRTWQLTKYNDAGSDRQLADKERVYIKPKRNKGKDKVHVVEAGQTLRQISQLHAVKLKRLLKYNGIGADQPLEEGTRVKLRR